MKKTSKYLSVFVIAVPKKKLPAYKKLMKLSAKVWLDCGALEYVECMSDDIPSGRQTSFPQSVKLKTSEVVFVGWMGFKSAKHYEQVMKKAMADSRMTSIEEIPFDGMRMYWGGFKPMISL